MDKKSRRRLNLRLRMDFKKVTLEPIKNQQRVEYG